MRLHRAAAVLLAATMAAAGPAAPALAQPAWADVDSASIRPANRVFTAGSQCTSNFVFTSGSVERGSEPGDVLIGMAAHCAGTGGSTATNGCETGSLPLGTPVEVDGAAHPGSLVYSSWLTMQAVGETDPATCAYNDFALVRLDPRDHGRVNPTMPVWGGPLGLSAGATSGSTVYTVGRTSLLPILDDKQGTIERVQGNGWSYVIRTLLLPGVPGDSGSGFLDASGRALGVLSTILLLPSTGANEVTSLPMALDYLHARTDLRVTVATSTEPFGPTGEQPPPPDTVPTTRLSGDDRYATAAAIAATVPAANAVVVATGVTPQDALTAGPAAAGLGAPLLLASRDGLPPAAVEQVDRLAPQVAFIIGGTGAVPATVDQQLRDAGVGQVTRIFGSDRYETATAVAERFGTPGAPLVVASGVGFADALAASPLAAVQGGMLVLTRPDRLPEATRDLLAGWNPSAMQVVGGAAVIPEQRRTEIAQAAGITPARLAGDDRYGTAAAAAQALLDASGFAFDGTVWLASGLDFPDALAGGPAVFFDRGVLLLVPRTGSLPTAVAEVAAGSGGERITVLGGTAAVPDAMAAQVGALLANG